MKNSLEKYLLSVISKNIDMDWVYQAQCVDLIKHYTINVMNISLWTFWGSAKTGWENKSNTFPKDDWIKIKNDFDNPEQTPEKWDIIFFSTWVYGHVWIVMRSYPWENKIKILNQNTGNWDWEWTDDRTRIEYCSYNDVLGWYRCKRFMVEYKWIPIFIRKQPSNKPRTNATYFRLRKYIVLYELYFTQTEEYQKAILAHEYAHHIWYTKIPSKTQKIWGQISNFDKSIQQTLEMFYWDKYIINAYVNSYAKTNIKEDFAECWEYYTRHWKPNFWDYRDIKVNVVIRIINKYIIQ